MDAIKLSNFAVIKSFSDNEASLLNCIMPYVEFGIAKIKKEYIDVSELKKYICTECLLDIPTATIQTLLKRLKKENKLTDYEHWTIIRCVDNYTQSSNRYEESVLSFSRELNLLIQECRKYCDFDISDNDTAQLLYDFINVYQHKINILDGTIELIDGNTDKKFDKISLFINYISQYKNNLYITFKNMFYGFILGQFIAAGKIFDKKKLGNLTVYIDTDFLLRALDMQAPCYTEASLELLHLLQSYGFNVIVLPEIIDEARDVLSANYAKYIEDGSNIKSIYGKSAAKLDGILGAFFRRFITSSQIGDYIDTLEDQIKKVVPLQIAQVGIPMNVKVNQTELNKIIEYKSKSNHIDHISNLNQKEYVEERLREKATLDAKLLSFIRMKRSKQIYRFQDARYILLSCDNAICRTNKMKHKLNNSIPESFSESSLTTTLFVSNPSQIGDVPIKLLVTIFQSSKFVDYSILSQFHEEIIDYIESNPDDQRYLTEVFRTQQLFAEIKGAYDFDDTGKTSESNIIKLLFDNAKKVDQEKNDQEKKLSEENLKLRQELNALKYPQCTEISEKSRTPTKDHEASSIRTDKGYIMGSNPKAENILRSSSLIGFIIIFLISVAIGIRWCDPTAYNLSLAWWTQCSKSFALAIFALSLTLNFHSQEVIQQVIARVVYDDKHIPVAEIIYMPIIRSVLCTLTAAVLPVISIIVSCT